jgi:hypothetical protein
MPIQPLTEPELYVPEAVGRKVQELVEVVNALWKEAMGGREHDERAGLLEAALRRMDPRVQWRVARSDDPCAQHCVAERVLSVMGKLGPHSFCTNATYDEVDSSPEDVARELLRGFDRR